MRTCKGNGASSSASPPAYQSVHSAEGDISADNGGATNSPIDERPTHGSASTPDGGRQPLGLGQGGSRANSLSNDASLGQDVSVSTASALAPVSRPSPSLGPEHLSNRPRSEADSGESGQLRVGIAHSVYGWGSTDHMPRRPPPNTQSAVDPVLSSQYNTSFRRNAVETPNNRGSTYPPVTFTNTTTFPPSSGTVASEDALTGEFYPHIAQQAQVQAPTRSGPPMPVAQRVNLHDYLRQMVPPIPLPLPPSSSAGGMAAPTSASGSTSASQSSSPTTSGSPSVASTPNSGSNFAAYHSPQFTVLGSGGHPQAPHLIPPLQQHDQPPHGGSVGHDIYDSTNPWPMPPTDAYPSTFPPPSYLPERQHAGERQQYEQNELSPQQTQYSGSQQNLYQYSRHGQQDQNRQRNQPTSISIPSSPPGIMPHPSFPQYATHRPHQIRFDPTGPSSSTPATSAGSGSSVGGNTPAAAYSAASHRQPSHSPPDFYGQSSDNNFGTGVEYRYDYGSLGHAPDHELATVSRQRTASAAAALVQSDQRSDGFSMMYPQPHPSTSSPMGLHLHGSHQTVTTNRHPAEYAAPRAGTMGGSAEAAASNDRAGSSVTGGDLRSPHSAPPVAYSHPGDSASRWEPQLQPHENYFYHLPGMPAYGDRQVDAYHPPQQQQGQGNHHFWPSSGGNLADPGPNAGVANPSQGAHTTSVFGYESHSRRGPGTNNSQSRQQRRRES